MWHLIFLFSTVMNIMGLIYPFLVSFDVKFNILRLRGNIIIKIFNKIKFEFKIRVKNGYVYINHKNKQRKEKISKTNFNLVWFLSLINQLYFREQFLNLSFCANFGFILDSRITATICGYLDVIAKSLFGSLKNNKKSSHIFVSVEPKYNVDIFNVHINNIIRISMFDLIYTLIYTIIYARGRYEKV